MRPAPMNGHWQYTVTIALVLVAPRDVFAERLVCRTIHRGETASQAAKRLTGDARNRHQPSFQIVDPATSRFVSKARYDRIRPGWRACIVRESAVSGTGSAVAVPQPIREVQAPVVNEPVPQPQVLGGANARSVIESAVRLMRRVDLSVVGFAALVWVIWLVWWLGEDYIAHRQRVVAIMMLFGERFVREFERPLIQEESEHPLRSQFRFSPGRSRLEIFLAPGEGRRYPNLADHRKNVEYDVARVVRSLADQSFVGDSLYEKQGWVVVSFQLKANSKRVGVT